ncbi:MAG: LPS export ABC transporter periplasmic protein LptC [Gemmatimonadota bacterium]|nr:LPS export ABC transporter periplasmic protein LptC [Gemmatimonadota bacterium]MDH5284452.1 LPS export ABC transporter periplasmic protein LptC [Gemmatimonadota bacterium]
MRPTGTWRALLYPGVAALALAGLPAGCADDGAQPSRTLTAADTADQILEKMEHVITDDGVRRTRVLSDTAYIYEISQIARLKVVKVVFFDENGFETSTVVADSGRYHMNDGSMDAWGNVFATTPDGRTLRSSELRYDAGVHQISSNREFTYDRGDQHLEGNGFTSDPDFRNVTTRQPRGGPGGADKPSSGFLLPGQ